MTPARTVNRPRIAIVDDHEDTRGVLRHFLAADGYEIVEFGDAQEALRVLGNGPPPDLILLDLRMPGMDGWEFRVEQNKHPSLAATPVIALSADSSSQARAIHAVAFLEKPPSLPELRETVRRVLDEHHEERTRASLTIVERMAALGRLAAGLAHEINNPLAYVLVNLNLVREELGRLKEGGMPTGEQRDALVAELDQVLAEAADGASRIERIVRDMRVVSYVDNEPLSPINVHSVLESTLRVSARSLERAQVVRSFGNPPIVLGNQARLGQVFMNLLLNAAQAIPGSATNGKIEITTAIGEAGEAIVVIADNGEGIRPELHAQIFDPFFTTKPVGVGSGLGLAICHGMLASMGGRISFESEPGCGTTFRVSLPAIASDDARPLPEPARPARLTRLRVLLVDDEPAIGRVLSRILRMDHQVTVVESGAEGIARALAEPFDIVICDLAMAEVSGADVFERLKAERPGLEKRIVFLTGGAHTERDRDLVAAVDNVVLEKPVGKKELVRAIEQTLARLERSA